MIESMTGFFDLGSPPEKTDLEYQIIEIALKQGKAIARSGIQKRTGSSTRKSWAQVKKILWLHPEVSLTPYRMTSWQRFVYNWRDLLTLIVFVGSARSVAYVVACAIGRFPRKLGQLTIDISPYG